MSLIINKIFRTRSLIKQVLREVEEIRHELNKISMVNMSKNNEPLVWSKVLQRDCLDIFTLIQPRTLRFPGKKRVGCAGDGGYVVPADWEKLDLMISLGIGPDNSFDALLASSGIKVESYDPTIDKLPTEHSLIRWHKKKVVPAVCDADNEITLSEILGKINDSVNVGLKCDIEGWEYPCLLSCPDDVLKKCRFIVCEFHGISGFIAERQTNSLKGVLQKLSKTFEVIHVHANNAVSGRFLGGMYVPDILEISFANKSFYKTEPCQELFPSNLDVPNDSSRCDIWLGSFQWSQAQTKKPEV